MNRRQLLRVMAAGAVALALLTAWFIVPYGSVTGTPRLGIANTIWYEGGHRCSPLSLQTPCTTGTGIRLVLLLVGILGAFYLFYRAQGEALGGQRKESSPRPLRRDGMTPLHGVTPQVWPTQTHRSLAMAQLGSRRRGKPRGGVAVGAMVLGAIAVLSGLGGNSAVLLLGIVAVSLGVWARSKRQRGPALWGLGLAGFAVLGYLGTILQQGP